MSKKSKSKPVIPCPTCNGIGTIPKEAISVTRFGKWKSDSPRVKKVKHGGNFPTITTIKTK